MMEDVNAGNDGEGTTCSYDLIRKMLITGTTSRVLKEFCHMPEPRHHHRAEAIDDKILVFAGW